MKKIIVFMLLIVTAVCVADESQKFYIFGKDGRKPMSTDSSNISLDGYIFAASSSDTVTVDMDSIRPVGYGSLQIEVSGSGTMKITHQSSNDCISFNTKDGASDIVTALTAGSAFYAFDMPFCKCLRLKFEETGGANSVTVTRATLAIQ